MTSYTPQKNLQRWTIDSKKSDLKTINLATGFVGLIFIFITYQRTTESSNVLAAFYLGYFLALMSLCVFIFSEDTTMEVCSDNERLNIKKASLLNSKIYVILFNQIKSVQITTYGSRSKGLPTFHILFKLKNGKTEATNYFTVSEDEAVQLAQRLINDIGCENNLGEYFNSSRQDLVSVFRVFASFVGSVFIYILWYKITIGQPCVAMWHGTTPVLIIGCSFLIIYRNFNRFYS